MLLMTVLKRREVRKLDGQRALPLLLSSRRWCDLAQPDGRLLRHLQASPVH